MPHLGYAAATSGLPSLTNYDVVGSGSDAVSGEHPELPFIHEDYAITSYLGRGGCAAVYEAQHREHGLIERNVGLHRLIGHVLLGAEVFDALAVRGVRHRVLLEQARRDGDLAVLAGQAAWATGRSPCAVMAASSLGVGLRSFASRPNALRSSPFAALSLFFSAADRFLPPRLM